MRYFSAALALLLSVSSAAAQSTNIAVLYWKSSGISWAEVAADSDAQITALQSALAVDQNSAVVLVPRQGFTEAQATAAIAKAFGSVPPDPTCAVLAAPDANSNQAIVDVIRADAAHVNGQALQNPGQPMQASGIPLMVGDRWNPTTAQFERFFSEANATSGVVVAQAWLPVVNPVPPAGDVLASSSNAIGSTVPVHPAATGTATPP